MSKAIANRAGTPGTKPKPMRVSKLEMALARDEHFGGHNKSNAGGYGFDPHKPGGQSKRYHNKLFN